MVAQPSEPIVFAVDTSSPQASFAIQRGNKVLAALATDNGTQHSQTFFPHLETLLKLAGIERTDINAIAAVTGPGSFTGLRVGLAAAQGLAQTLNVKAIGLTTLDVMALSAGVTGRVLVLLDAGRGEVFAGLRDITLEGRFTQPQPDQSGRIENLLPAWRNETSLFIVGSGAALLERHGLSVVCSSHAQWSQTAWQILQPITFTAPVLARYAVAVLPEAEKHPLKACYIRPSDAEMKAAA